MQHDAWRLDSTANTCTFHVSGLFERNQASRSVFHFSNFLEGGFCWKSSLGFQPRVVEMGAQFPEKVSPLIVLHTISCCLRSVAMALVESVAAFEQRCDELNATGGIKVGLRNQGINCFSLLAFAVGSPQSPPTEAELTAFAQTVYGAVPTKRQLANLKRLYFEATTLVIASLEQSVANETSDQQATLKKLLVGELEPSHDLVDLANHILETGSIIP